MTTDEILQTLSKAQHGVCADTTLARGLTTLPRLQRTLDDVAVRGRRGVVVMREVVRDRVKGLKPTESGLEFRFHQLANFAALPGFERQVDVGDDHDWIGRVDFLHRRLQLIVECGTALHHGSLSDQRRDEERRARYEATGWRVEVFTDVDLFYRRDEVIDRLRRLRQRPVPRQLAERGPVRRGRGGRVACGDENLAFPRTR